LDRECKPLADKFDHERKLALLSGWEVVNAGLHCSSLVSTSPSGKRYPQLLIEIMPARSISSGF
jgi:hypothetical protein